MNKEYLIQNLKHWDWESYGKENKDLRYDSSSLFNHALRHGIKEGRTLKFDKNKNFLKHKDVDLVEYFNKLDNFFIIQPIFGLSNRLRTIASAYSICKELNRNLIINWIQDCHCDCRIEDLITNIDDLCVAVIDNINTNKLMKLGVSFQRNYNDNPIIDHTKKKIYIESNCALNNKFSGKHSNSFLKSLMFNTEINNLINSIPNINEHIGMHIRMEGGKEYTSNEYEKESNWDENGKRELFKYREISHIDNFINQINNILHKNPEQKFFIATDMKVNYKKLIDIYGNDTIKFLHRDLFDRSKKQIYYAIADIILLSKCKQFYGSTWSSFSELVTYFQDTNVENLNIFTTNFEINNINNFSNKNLLNKSIKNGNSVLIGCRNRIKNLYKVLTHIIDYPNIDEIVVVDWNSDRHIKTEKEIIELCSIFNKLKIYTVTNVDKWIHTKVWNLGCLLCEYENIYKIDCEILPHKYFIHEHPLNDFIFYHGHWKDKNNKIKDSDKIQIVGSIFCKRKNLLTVNLWNEHIRNYGWEDSNIYERLSENLKKIYIDDVQFNFITDDDKNKNYLNDVVDELTVPQKIQKNRLLTNVYNIYNWNSRNIISKYNYIDNNNFEIIQNDYSLHESFVNKELLTKIFLDVKKY